MWLNPQNTADLVTFIEEILNGKYHILCNKIFSFVIKLTVYEFIEHLN